MGYTLTIGNAVLDYNPEYPRVDIRAEMATHNDAPDHDPDLGKSNKRSPSHTAWAGFCQDAGIYALFYGQGWDRTKQEYRGCSDGFYRKAPLLAEHPGVQPICRADLEYIRAARVRREQTNGGMAAGFTDGTDPTLARLLWLEFWVGWALDNCPVPVIHNS